MMRLWICVLVMTCMPFAASATDIQKKLTFYGDARLRFESDFDGRTRDGSKQNDRDRLRIRNRLGLRFQADEAWRVEGRVRTGSRRGQQSPHVTIRDFNVNDRGDANIVMDRLFVQREKNGHRVWVGRNTFPFWSLDEILWDEDVTLLGGAWSVTKPITGAEKITFTTGAFALPAGMDDFSGHLAAADMVYAHKRGDDVYSAGVGYFDFIPDKNDDDAGHFADGNGFRPYKITTWNAKAEWIRFNKPIVLELEYLYNVKHYNADATDAYTAANRNERNGYVASFHVGDLDRAGHWIAAYSYAHVGALAINSSFGADEWARWGSDNGQNRANDMRGHQINAGYAFTDNVNALLRAYFVESIKTQEQGSRVRLDLNYRF